MRSVTNGQSAYWSLGAQTNFAPDPPVSVSLCPSHIFLTGPSHLLPSLENSNTTRFWQYPSSRHLADCDYFKKCGLFPFSSSVLGQILMQEPTTQPSMKKLTILSKVTFCDPLDACLMSSMWYVGVLTFKTIQITDLKVFCIGPPKINVPCTKKYLG